MVNAIMTFSYESQKTSGCVFHFLSARFGCTALSHTTLLFVARYKHFICHCSPTVLSESIIINLNVNALTAVSKCVQLCLDRIRFELTVRFRDHESRRSQCTNAFYNIKLFLQTKRD